MSSRASCKQLSGDSGASSVEHALVLALVVLAALGAWGTLGTSVDDRVTCAAHALWGSAGPCTRPEPADWSASGHVAPAHQAAALASDAALLDNGDTNGDGVVSPDEYRAQVKAAIDAARRQFEELWEGYAWDKVITERSLHDAAPYRGEAGAVARFLLDNPMVRHAMDVGEHRRGPLDDDRVDGEIAYSDIAGFYSDFQTMDLWELLADTAAGTGGNDDLWSEADLEAMRNDATLPDEFRLRAGTISPNTCGFFCRMGRIGSRVVKAIASPIQIIAHPTWIIHPTRIFRFIFD